MGSKNQGNLDICKELEFYDNQCCGLHRTWLRLLVRFKSVSSRKLSSWNHFASVIEAAEKNPRP